MKKYLLVCWKNYYPSGGLGNIKHSFDTVRECIEYEKENKHELCDWYDHIRIYDRDTSNVVFIIKDE